MGKEKKLFSEDDFEKRLHVGDELVFDKPNLKKLRIELEWSGTDLDICAFMLGKDGMIHERADLVYFGSDLRWKTEKKFTDKDFNPLKGSFSQWETASKHYKNEGKWMEDTLPISCDGAVIGSWDDKTNEADEDCGEKMHVLLEEVDTRKYYKIVFAAAVDKAHIAKGETFADAHDPVVTIYNAEDDSEIAEYRLASDFPGKDVVCFGRMEYNSKNKLWTFIPMDESYNGGMQYLAREVYD
ncbi:MAG: TerD family protein [Muribaculaceae bacterium]|nr:TerD family protein [Muribaculaceae bacterium]